MDTEVNTLSTSLTCELNIIRAKNIEFMLPGRLFVRYYLLGKAGERIRLNTQEISSTCDLHWNEHISLECCGAADPMKELSQQSVVFELRWRSTAPVIGRIVGSKLLGRAEIAWRDVLGSTGMSLEKWTMLATPGNMVVGLKPPALQPPPRTRYKELYHVQGGEEWKKDGLHAAYKSVPCAANYFTNTSIEMIKEFL